MADDGFSGKVVLITGASSGIGRAAAIAFAQRGADLVLAARREDRLRELADQLHRLGRRAEAVVCDVTQDEQVFQLSERARTAFGAVDVLINNAGVGLYGPVEKCTDAQLERVFAVNFFGAVKVIRATLPLLRGRSRPQIVNVSSVLGHRGLPMLAGYCASKAALNALTESLRVELAGEGIHVLLVSPGLTDTDFREARLHAEGYAQERPPLKAMSSETVADAIVEACRRGKRDTVLTWPGRAMVYANRVSPALFDRVARRMVGPPEPETR